MYRAAHPATDESAGMKTVVKDEKGHKKTLSKLVALLGALGEMDWLDCDCLLFRPGNILHDRGMHVEVIRGR